VRRIIPLGHRPGEPEEMGEAVAYLASDAAGYTTGAYIRVDGGLVMTPY
jgi:glucose 1-dehydrogenase